MALSDPRNIKNGTEIPSEGYCDQPYVVQTDDGAWLCVLTTGQGREGERGQHVVTTRSLDQGVTWSEPVAVEPTSGPEASYAVLLKTPSGRVYCFYNHNTEDRRYVLADDPPYAGGKCRRVDSQGYFVFKYSDDHGQSWSAERYPVPVREMDIDRKNPYGGEVRFFWNVGKPFIHGGAAYVSLHKVGGFGHGFFTRSEGVLLRSENLLTESDPERIAWETLPAGEFGLRTPPGGGTIAEEQSYTVLSDGTLYAVYRTIDGYPAEAYSDDGGYHWTSPRYKRYADGRLMKHPRAANFVWKVREDRYLYWFHNHGGTWYENRNPAWLSAGEEVDTPAGRRIRWSQPEIALYDDEPYVRISYPDLIEDGDAYYLTETQKNVARVHRVPDGLLAALWGQFDREAVVEEGLLLALPGQAGMPQVVAMPTLPAFSEQASASTHGGRRDLRAGFSLDLWVRFEAWQAGQTLLDARRGNQGLCLRTIDDGRLELILGDGQTVNCWDSDPGWLSTDRWHHVGVIVDGGPKVILFVMDGHLCDGGEARQFGWGRFSPHLVHANGASTLRLAPELAGEVGQLRLYGRALRVSEMIGNYRADRQEEE